MTTNNGTVSFTKQRSNLEVEGYTFHTRPIDPDDWANVLNEGSTAEAEALKKERGTVLAVSAEGINNLILLAIVEEEHAAWAELRAKKLIDFGQLDAIRQWVWKEMTARPFSSDSDSGDGAGTDEASSKGGSRSRAAAAAS